MRRALSRGFVVVAGFLAATQHAEPDISKKELAAASDVRTHKIRKFFEKNDCPASQYAKDFVLAADQNRLDWRLLPSLSFLETTGGKYQTHNNMFGWSNGEAKFPSIRGSIYFVASRLNRAKVYRGKSTTAKLRRYNTDQAYAGKVQTTMRVLSATPAY